MKPIPNKVIKLKFLSEAQGGNCSIAADEGKTAPINELHHRLHDSNINIKRYPLFIHSVFNLTAVNHLKHMERPHFGKIRLHQADNFEKWLLQHPPIEVWANDPIVSSDAIIRSYLNLMCDFEVSLKGGLYEQERI